MGRKFTAGNVPIYKVCYSSGIASGGNCPSVQPTDPAKKDINHNRNTPQHEDWCQEPPSLPKLRTRDGENMKVFDGLTLNADAFVWLRELVAHRAREMLILQELPAVSRLPP